MAHGQRISHMAPERRRRIRDLRGELFVGPKAGPDDPLGQCSTDIGRGSSNAHESELARGVDRDHLAPHDEPR